MLAGPIFGYKTLLGPNLPYFLDFFSWIVDARVIFITVMQRFGEKKCLKCLIYAYFREQAYWTHCGIVPPPRTQDTSRSQAPLGLTL